MTTERDELAKCGAELDKATRGAKTLGEIIEKQCRDVLNVTGLHHLINEDGDGAWDVVWFRLFEMRDELASLKESTIGRERLRGDSWRDRAQEMEVSRDATAAELADRDEKLARVEALMVDPEHYDSQGPSNGYVSVDNLRAAVAAANGGGEQCLSVNAGRQCLLRPGHAPVASQTYGHIYPAEDS